MIDPVKVVGDALGGMVTEKTLELRTAERDNALAKLAEAEQKCSVLEQQLAAALERLRLLELVAERHEVPTDFVEARGALFKRRPDGSFHQAVYCTECKKPASAAVIGVYACDRCAITYDVTTQDLPGILRELERDAAGPRPRVGSANA